MARQVVPSSFEEAAAALAGAAGAAQSVRIVGAGTKSGWGTPAPQPDIELHTSELDEVLEHNAGDLTAILQAGVPVATAQKLFAGEGQMLALDPALGRDGDQAATIGGLVATGDCGPLRHRYGAPRDLVVGMTVALSDGTIARSGGKVIKNVAGYDVAKLFCGAFGTLGVILSVSVRLHPRPSESATALGGTDDPEVLRAAALTLAKAPLELEALDLAWRDGRGGILAQVAGAEAVRRAQRVGSVMSEAGLQDVDYTTDDAPLWAQQRAGQRAQDGLAMVRIAGRPSRLSELLRLSDEFGGAVVGRAALGTAFVELEPSALAGFRAKLGSGSRSVILDAPAELRSGLDAWGGGAGPAVELMRRVKQRFDPAHVCNPGVFVGGI